MTNRERYNIDCLESVSEGPHICIYYYPENNKNMMILVAILTTENGQTVSDAVVDWLDSEYKENSIKYLYETCE